MMTTQRASFVTKLVDLGTKEMYSELLNAKIRIANRVALLLVAANVFFLMIASFLQIPVYEPICYFILAYLVVFGLNVMGYPGSARWCLAAFPPVSMLYLQIILTNADAAPLAALYLTHFAFLALPWVIFDFKEPVFLITASVFTAFTLLLIRPLAPLWELEQAVPILRTLYFEYLLFCGAAFVLFSSLYFWAKRLSNADEKIHSLTQEIELQKKTAEENQHKLSTYIVKIERTQEENRQRQWNSEGLAKFATVLRSHQTVKGVCEGLINEIIKYVGAVQGAFFIAHTEEEHEHFLTLEACYAFEKQRYLNKKIYSGQGLVGQAYKSKDTIHLTEIPPDYVQITTGLGKALPRTILLVPLQTTERICGVLELASFQFFEEYQIDFLQKLCENIAATIVAMEGNERTRILLTEAQSYSEQMRAQEEEMRQNLEELLATQEAVARKEREYTQQISVLEKELARYQKQIKH